MTVGIKSSCNSMNQQIGTALKLLFVFPVVGASKLLDFAGYLSLLNCVSLSVFQVSCCKLYGQCCVMPNGVIF